MKKKCSKCNQEKRLVDFYNHKWAKDGKHSECKECTLLYSKEKYKRTKVEHNLQSKKYYNEHKEHLLKLGKERRIKYKDRIQEYTKKHDLKIKEKMFEMYGNACSCCGETIIEFLTLDHVQGQVGLKNKEIGWKAYRNAIKKYNPDRYRILCMNCNMATKYGNICPHKRDK